MALFTLIMSEGSGCLLTTARPFSFTLNIWELISSHNPQPMHARIEIDNFMIFLLQLINYLILRHIKQLNNI